MIDTCFFCDKYVVPINLITTSEVTKFFKDNGIEFTLNYARSKNKIGNKIICMSCELDLKRIVDNFDCDCENCKSERDEEESEDSEMILIKGRE